MLLQRNVDIPNGGVVSGKLDFESGVAFAAASAITTVQNSLGDSLKSSSALVSADGREVTVFEESTASTDVSRVTAGLPQSRLIGGELLSVSITGEESLGGASGEARSVTRYVNAVSNQTLALPPRLPALTIGQVTATGYPRLQFRASLPQEYRGLMWLWVQTRTGDRVRVDAAHPLRMGVYQGESRPYVRIRRNLDALVHRNVLFHLVALGELIEQADRTLLRVDSGDQSFWLGVDG